MLLDYGGEEGVETRAEGAGRWLKPRDKEGVDVSWRREGVRFFCLLPIPNTRGGWNRAPLYLEAIGRQS